MAEYRGHSDSVAALSAAPDGARFASGGWDGAVHLWDTGAATVEAAGEAAAEGAAGAAKKRRSGAGGQVADAPAVLQVPLPFARSCDKPEGALVWQKPAESARDPGMLER